MPTYIDFALSALTSAGITVALFALLTWLARTWVGERIKGSIQYEYNRSLASLNAQLKSQGDTVAAQLKGEMDREAEKLRMAAQSFSETQKAVIAKRLSAVEKTWETILLLHDEIPAVVHHLDILVDDEYPSAKNNSYFSRDLVSLDNAKNAKSAFTRSRELSSMRPYIGEYLWALFFTYQAVLMRTAYLVNESKRDSNKLLWFSDSLIRRHIQSALGEEGLKEMDRIKLSKTMWVRDKFTNRILQAMEHIIAGKEFSDAAMRQAQDMEAQLRRSKREESESN